MTYPLRKLIQGVTYHCWSRCHGKRNLLMSRECRTFLVESIQMCQEKYDFELYAAEPVGNHIHIVIGTVRNGETVSSIMQYIKARMAEKYNRHTGNTGAFWNERFGCKIIEEEKNAEAYMLWLLWYIGFNPVRKGLVSDPRDGHIGFINCYLNRNFKAAVNITLHRCFHELGTGFEQCVQRFLFYEDAYRKRLAVCF